MQRDLLFERITGEKIPPKSELLKRFDSIDVEIAKNYSARVLKHYHQEYLLDGEVYTEIDKDYKDKSLYRFRYCVDQIEACTTTEVINVRRRIAESIQEHCEPEFQPIAGDVVDLVYFASIDYNYTNAQIAAYYIDRSVKSLAHKIQENRQLKITLV